MSQVWIRRVPTASNSSPANPTWRHTSPARRTSPANPAWQLVTNSPRNPASSRTTVSRRAGSGYVGRESNPEDAYNQICQRVGQVAIATCASLATAFAANAGGAVKLGSDSGGLVFDPATVEIAKGEEVVWTNNAGFPHNIVFDEDAVPAGENAEKLSREDYLNAPGEQFKMKFNTPGTYEYYCEPHRGAGMVGKIIVK